MANNQIESYNPINLPKSDTLACRFEKSILIVYFTTLLPGRSFLTIPNGNITGNGMWILGGDRNIDLKVGSKFPWQTIINVTKLANGNNYFANGMRVEQSPFSKFANIIVSSLVISHNK